MIRSIHVVSKLSILLMMKFAVLINIVQILHLVNSQSLTKYVIPARSSSSLCLAHSEQCITLNEYATDPEEHFLSNTNFIFLPGTHKLNNDLRLENLQNVSLLRVDSE